MRLFAVITIKAWMCWGVDEASLERLVFWAQLRWCVEQFHRELILICPLMFRGYWLRFDSERTAVVRMGLTVSAAGSEYVDNHADHSMARCALPKYGRYQIIDQLFIRMNTNLESPSETWILCVFWKW